MNDHEIDRIAAAMHQLRPDWPAASLRTLIRKKLADRPRRDVAVALAWVACETGTSTPARVLEAGPWWRAAGVEGNAPRPNYFDPDLNCHVCSRLEHRHGPLSGHEFETATTHARRLAHDGNKRPMRELIEETS